MALRNTPRFFPIELLGALRRPLTPRRTLKAADSMSAKGQKRAFAVQNAMSRFTSKADIAPGSITQTKDQVLAKARPQALYIRPIVL